MRIFLPKTLKNNGGFTLIEIVIVLVLVAGLVAYTVPRLSTGDKVKSAIRRLTIITKQTQTAARLSGMIHRLVVEMPEDENIASTYWVEKATTKNLKLYASDEEDKDKKEGEETSSTNFDYATKITKKKENLPSGFYFEDIEFSEKSKISVGKAYVYFFPQGFVTKVAIHITDRKKIKWSIIVNPLTGQGSVVTEYKSLKDLQK